LNKTASAVLLTAFLFFQYAGSSPAYQPAFSERLILTTAADTNRVILKTAEKYDARGNLVESLRYLPNGTLQSRNTWQYDLTGKKISESRYDSQGGISSALTFRYDENGTLTEQDRRFGAVPLGTVYYEDPGPPPSGTNTVYLSFGDTGLLLTRRTVDCSGATCQIISFFHDRRNRQVDADYYDPDNRLIKRVKSSYDTNQRVTGLTVYDASGALTAQSTFTYDGQGRLVERKEYDPDTSALIATTRSVWEAGLLERTETVDGSGQLTAVVEYSYDGWGRPLKEKRYGFNDAVHPPERTVIRTTSYQYK
jgi:YD repeat-containing protein